MIAPSIIQKRRGVTSKFKEGQRSKLSVKFNDDESAFLNAQAKSDGSSLGEIVRRAVRSVMEAA